MPAAPEKGLDPAVPLPAPPPPEPPVLPVPSGELAGSPPAPPPADVIHPNTELVPEFDPPEGEVAPTAAPPAPTVIV